MDSVTLIFGNSPQQKFVVSFRSPFEWQEFGCRHLGHVMCLVWLQLERHNPAGYVHKVTSDSGPEGAEIWPRKGFLLLFYEPTRCLSVAVLTKPQESVQFFNISKS
jgi:hypothetical protein